jgi:hypothetical protein
MKDVPVWDLPTRLFHWLLALSVGTNLIVRAALGSCRSMLPPAARRSRSFSSASSGGSLAAAIRYSLISCGGRGS